MNKLDLILKSSTAFVICLALQACATTTQSREVNEYAKNILQPNKQEENLYPVVVSFSSNNGMIPFSLIVESITEKTLVMKKIRTI
jgi:hypothetical protein